MAAPWEKYGAQPAPAPMPSPGPWGKYAKLLDGEILPPETTAASLADNAVTGAGETLLTLPGVPAELALRGLDWAANKGLGTRRMTEAELAGNPIGVNMTRNMWRDWFGIPIPGAPKTTADKYARTMGGFVGGGLLTGPINPSTIAASAGGGAGSQLASDVLPDQWWAPFVGGLLGAGATNAAASVPRGLIPKTTPARAEMAQELMSRGVPVAPGQLATNWRLQNYWDLARKLSLTDDNFFQKQSDAINRVAAKTMGATADDITPQVMLNTKQALGNEFERIFGKNTIPIDNQVLTELGAIETKALANLTEAQFASIRKALDNVTNEAANRGGALPGRVYHALTSKGGALNSVVKNSDPNVAHYGQQIRNALDDAFERSAPQADVDALRTVRGQYKNMKTLESLAARSGEGDISPVKLLSRVAVNDKSSAYTGGGDLGLLGRAGQSFLKPPRTSGTAERLSLLDAAGNITLSPLTLPTKKLLQAQWLTRMMIDKARKQSSRPPAGLLGRTAQLGRSATPVLPGLLTRQYLPMQNAGLLAGP